MVREYLLLIDRLIFRWNLIYAPSFRNCRSPKVWTMCSNIRELQNSKLQSWRLSVLIYSTRQFQAFPPLRDIYICIHSCKKFVGLENYNRWKWLSTNFIIPWIIMMVYFQGESKQFHDGMEIHRAGALIIIQKQLNKK